MPVKDFLKRNYVILVVLSIIFLSIYGICQLKIVRVFQNVCFQKVEGFTFFITVFANIFVFFSGFLSVGFITLITYVCYNTFFEIELEKKYIFLLATIGYVVCFIAFPFINNSLNNLELEFSLGLLNAESLKANQDYINIMIINKITNGIYYIYMLFVVNFFAKDTWKTFIKYGLLLLVVYYVQNFILNAGV